MPLPISLLSSKLLAALAQAVRLDLLFAAGRTMAVQLSTTSAPQNSPRSPRLSLLHWLWAFGEWHPCI